MALKVVHTNSVSQSKDFQSDRSDTPSYSIALSQYGNHGIIAHGFARRKDAELGIKTLMEELDWPWNENNSDVIVDLIEKIGGHQGVMNIACKGLQW